MSESGFYLMVTGQIEACKMSTVDNLYCRYHYKFGKDWRYVNGLEFGMSQIARSVSGSEGVFVWNYPIDTSFRSTNPYGWPQLVISLYGFNIFGKDVVRGYGFIHIPTTPGRHERYIKLYAPRSSSICSQIVNYIFGSPPEYFDSNFVAQGKGREVTRVSSNGCVKVVFNVATKNMKAFGYSVNDSMTSAMQDELQEKAA